METLGYRQRASIAGTRGALFVDLLVTIAVRW